MREGGRTETVQVGYLERFFESDHFQYIVSPFSSLYVLYYYTLDLHI